MKPSVTTASLLASCALFVSLAGKANADPGATASVGLFDRACYSTMPDIGATEALANDGKWQPIVGTDLDAYRPAVEPDVIKAWKLELDGASHSISITQSPMDEIGKTDFPKFADATNYSCSLVLPATTPKAAIGAEMEKLLERKPDEAFEEDPWSVSVWTGGTDKLLVMLHHYAPKAAPSGGLLSITVFQNP